MRVAVVTNYIPEYRFPVFEQLVRDSRTQYWFLTSSPLNQSCQEARDNLRLKHSVTLNVMNKTHHTSTGTIQRELVPVPFGLCIDLFKIRPSVIISGDYGLRSLLCWLMARVLRSRFVIWSEEIASSARGRTWLQRRLRRLLSQKADACLAWGEPAYRYSQSLGVSDRNIYHCAQAIDNKRWMQRAVSTNREQARKDLRLSGVVFLLVGRMVERKGFRNFIQAWSVANKGTKVAMTAVIVGNGAQETELRELAAINELTNVRFAGAQMADELARYYAAADVLVFPSLEDVWGMVANEALCFGLPILGSKYAGASQQLLAEPGIGVVVDPVNLDDFSLQIEQLATSPPPRDVSRARTLFESINFDRSVQAITEMIERFRSTRVGVTDLVEGDTESPRLNIASSRDSPKRITIIQQVLPHYRAAFFCKLHERLAKKGIELHLLYGNKNRGPADSAQFINAEWAHQINTVTCRVGRVDLVWQAALGSLADSELVIVEQSNRLLINYLLQLRSVWSSRKLAFWGHGRNMQSEWQSSLSEILKVFLLPRVDWWFAYTSMTRDYLIANRYPEPKITLVNNAAEDKMAEHIRCLSKMDRKDVAAELGLTGTNVALFCGGLYKQKRIDFLLQAAQQIRQHTSDFELLIVGEGPDRILIEQASRQYSWIHFAGHVVGEAVAKYWYVSKVLLMPGLVGLAIVDSFNAACPMVTTSYPYHSPEIAYLKSGFNGLMTDNDVNSFAQGVTSLLKDDGQRSLLCRGCVQSASTYTLENMVENFATGIEQCVG